MDRPDATPLSATLKPCGPVVNGAAAARTFETLDEAARADGWTATLEAARAGLAPVFGAAPYLAALAVRDPERLRASLESAPATRLEALIGSVEAIAAADLPTDEVKQALRQRKGDLHLLCALCDLAGVWDLDAVTGALSRFADAAVRSAFAVVARDERERGRLVASPDDPCGPIPGLFGLAMGKHGAFELNYSSDIDVSFFFEPETLAPLLREGVEPQAFVNRCAQALTALMAERTPEGYVFRVDLRLRPDPSTTPPVVPAQAALTYYETVGQNWERAAFIKARPLAGDLEAAEAFLRELGPYVWRRSLDYAAIADVHSIKRQIHVHRADERVEAAGANLKLGRGGIREIEFFVQTQQLILGGRAPGLRSSRTLDALLALSDAGHVAAAAAEDLREAYVRLRALEHRVQMLEDEQTHTLPEDGEARLRVAALAGYEGLAPFDREVSATLATVNSRYGDLFSEAEPLSSDAGSLVFTGVEDDPETLATLGRMGFSAPAQVSATIRSWHHGSIPATRTARGRELFTRLAPRLLEAARNTGAPDAAFGRFAAFFSGLSAGVQTQSLFLAQPALFAMVVEVMAFAPRLASTLARRPAALDALLDGAFFAPLDEDSGVCGEVRAVGSGSESFEAAMDAVRRIHREQAFRIGVQVMTGAAGAEEAGRAFADLADACVQGLAPAALAETLRVAGAFPGEAAVVALGKFGSREMTARSDLDLMTVYRAADPAAASALKGWAAETVFGRFTQRLIAALSAPTAEGGLYDIDMQLRPSGAKGPVAVSLTSMAEYYESEADTWELLALTRARVVWATSPDFGDEVAAAVEAALRRRRDPACVARDVRTMRALMERERPATDFWDLKLSPGGLVDAEFLAQHLQLVDAPSGARIEVGTLAALAAAAGRRPDAAVRIADAARAWRTQQNLDQLLKAALDERASPDAEPPRFQALLARAGGAADFDDLKRRIAAERAAARSAFETLVGGDGKDAPPR